MCPDELPSSLRQLTLENWAQAEGLPNSQRLVLRRALRDATIKLALPLAADLRRNRITQSVGDSGARCFTYYAIDFGVVSLDSQSPTVVAYEVNEYPYIDEEAPDVARIQRRGHTELLEMMGLRRAISTSDIECSGFSSTVERYCRSGWQGCESPRLKRAMGLLLREDALSREWDRLYPTANKDISSIATSAFTKNSQLAYEHVAMTRFVRYLAVR